MRYLLVAAVFALDVWALAGMYATPLRRRARLAWTGAIVLLPVAGAVLWLRRAAGPQRSAEGEHDGRQDPGGG